MTTMDTLIAERAALQSAEYNSYSASDFPGSRRWWAHKQDRDALAAFDATHPEVAAAMRAAKPTPAYVTDPDSQYNRVHRGED